MFRIAAVVLVALLAGCAAPTINHRYNLDPGMDKLPAAEKTSLRAGVYYSPALLAREQRRISGTNRITLPIGAASATMFDDLLARVFAKTTRLESLAPEELAAKGVDLAMTLAIEHFDFAIGFDAESKRYGLTYRLTMVSPQGVPAASWLVTGAKPDSRRFGVWGPVEENMEIAASQFLATFRERSQPGVAAIARARAAPMALDRAAVVLRARQAPLPGIDAKQWAVLREQGVVVVEVSAQSKTDRPVLVRASDMRLIDGKDVLEPTPVSSVLSSLDQMSNTYMTTSMLVGPVIGVLANASEQRTIQGERDVQHAAASAMLFQERTLAPDKDENGLVLFRLPEGRALGAAARLSAWIVEPGSAAGALAEAPLE